MFKPERLLVFAWTVILSLALIPRDAVADAPCPRVGFTVVELHGSSETRPVRVGRNRTIYVRRVPITTTSDILVIKLRPDGSDDASLLLKFTPAATRRLIDATNRHAGRRIAFMFDDEILLDVAIPGPYGFDASGAEVSMRHGMEPAQRIMKAIRGCTAVSVSHRAR